jgi:hypothetical protein
MRRKDNDEVTRINTKRNRFFCGVSCRFVIPLLTVFIMATGVFAQTAYTPEKGSTERKAILDGLRVPVEKELKQKVIFVVDHLKVQGNWAFVSGTPQGADGERPNYTGTQYQEAIDADMFDNNYFALLKKTGGKWRVVTHAIGCTDVCYVTWWQDHKAPKTIFPYTE